MPITAVELLAQNRIQVRQINRARPSACFFANFLTTKLWLQISGPAHHRINALITLFYKDLLNSMLAVTQEVTETLAASICLNQRREGQVGTRRPATECAGRDRRRNHAPRKTKADALAD
jgi:hypothetical protein